MRFEDIIALAKQGYKPSDIKELMSLGEEPKAEPQGEEPKAEPQMEEPKAEPQMEEPKAEPKNEELEKVKAELEQTKETLKKAQEHNARQNNAGNVEDDEKVLEEWCNSFL